MSDTSVFWLCYFGINLLFFLPRYLLEFRNSTFFPYKGLLSGPVKERLRYLINRFNYDIFRVSVDWFAIAMVLLIFQPVHHLVYWHWSIWGLFVLLWSYQMYYHIVESIYRVEPVFYSDRLLLQTGMQLFFKGFNRMNLAIISGLGGMLIVSWWVVGFWIRGGQGVDLGWISYGVIGVFGALSLYSLLTYNYKAFGKIAFSSQLQSLVRNILLSQKTSAYFRTFNFSALSQHQPYAHLKLRSRPNIYFLVVESYGKYALEAPDLHESVIQKLAQVQELLKANGWESCSQLSEAPITGGASWISYTSALFGFPIPDQGVYLSLLHHPEMRKYQHFMRWLKAQGYHTCRLAPIAGFEDMKIPWSDYEGFYAIDEWIHFRDMGYRGPLYGFGPCPPDQYSLWYAANHLEEQKAAPHFVFFITQNSHSPFTGPEAVAANWRDLIDPNAPMNTHDSASIFAKPLLSDYQKAIHYQLDFISDFITKKGNSEDLFILIGDHQPPVFPGPDADRATPIHIIHRSDVLVKSFEEYGFQAGMLPELNSTGMKHEALFSILVRSLMKHYGEDGVELPAFLPEGIDIESLNYGST